MSQTIFFCPKCKYQTKPQPAAVKSMAHRCKKDRKNTELHKR